MYPEHNTFIDSRLTSLSVIQDNQYSSNSDSGNISYAHLRFLTMNVLLKFTEHFKRQDVERVIAQKSLHVKKEVVSRQTISQLEDHT